MQMQAQKVFTMKNGLSDSKQKRRELENPLQWDIALS